MFTIPSRGGWNDTISTDSHEPIQGHSHLHCTTNNPSSWFHWQFTPLNQMGPYNNTSIWPCSQSRARTNCSHVQCPIKKWPLRYHRNWSWWAHVRHSHLNCPTIQFVPAIPSAFSASESNEPERAIRASTVPWISGQNNTIGSLPPLNQMGLYKYCHMAILLNKSQHKSFECTVSH